MRAQKRDVTGRSFFAENREISEQQTVFRARWRGDLTTEMRVRYEDRLYDIRSLAEIGRRRWLDIAAVVQGV